MEGEGMLLRIKRAEEESERKIQEAMQQSEKIISDGRAKAVAIEQEMAEKESIQANEEIEKAADKADKANHIILEKKIEEIKKMKSAAEKRLPKAVDFLMKELNNLIMG